MNISGAGTQLPPSDVKKETRQASGTLPEAAKVVTTQSRTVSVVEVEEDACRKSDTAAAQPPQPSNRKNMKKTRRSFDLSSTVGRDKTEAELMLNSVKTVRKLGDRAEAANGEIVQFRIDSRDQPDKLLHFWQAGGPGMKFSDLAQECYEFCNRTTDEELFSPSVSERVRLRGAARDTYFSGKCCILNLLGNYNGVGAECAGIGLLSSLPEAIQSGFTGKGLDRDSLGEGLSTTIIMFLDSLKYLENYLNILKKESHASSEDLQQVEDKMRALVSACYRQIGGLLCIAQEAITNLHTSGKPCAKAFPGEPLEQAFSLVNRFYGHFARTDQGKTNEWLSADRFFKVPQSVEGACIAWCYRVVAGFVSGHFEMAQSSMKALAELCKLPETERVTAYTHFQQKALIPEACVKVVCDLSLMISRRLPKHNVTDIVQVQKMRKLAVDYLADVKCWWSKMYPPGTDKEGDIRHHQLDKLSAELEAEIEGTVKRALAALEMMCKIKQVRKKKKPDINPLDLIGGFVELEKPETEPETEPEPGATVAKISADVAAKRDNQENLKKAVKYLRENKLKDGRRLFLGVAASNSENTTTEQRIWANYGLVDVHKTMAQQAFEKCQRPIRFLQAYEACLKENQLPDIQEGQQFKPEVEAFKEAFGIFSINMSIMNSYIQDLSKILLSEDTSLIKEDDLHLSLDMIKTECCGCIRTLNEFAARLEEICQRRKTLLSQPGFQGRGAASTPYDYKGSLQTVAKSQEKLEKLLTELESEFESHYQALASSD